MVCHQGVPTYTQRDPAGSSGLGCSTDVQKPAELKGLLLRALTCPNPTASGPSNETSQQALHVLLADQDSHSGSPAPSGGPGLIIPNHPLPATPRPDPSLEGAGPLGTERQVSWAALSARNVPAT